MTEGRQLFTAEIKTLAKGPSTYDPLETQSARSYHSRNKLRTRPFEPEADLQTFIPPLATPFLQQRLGIFQVQRVETFGEPVVDWHEEVMSRRTRDPARAQRRSPASKGGGRVGPIEQDAVPIHLPVRC